MNSKRKGNTGEREVLQKLIDAGIDAHRNDQTFVGGIDNPDISASICDIPLHVEVKRKERFSIYDAMHQATRDANGHALPIVLYRKNREKWLAIVPLDDVLKLINNNLGL